MNPNFNRVTVNQMLNGFVKVFYLLLLFVISGCNNENQERREISVEEILISANKKSKLFKDIEKGSLKYTSEPDGLKELSLDV
jgi:AAA15 family ATPase/GTPase